MESFAAVVLDGMLSDVNMPRLVVDALSTAGKPAGCFWFLHEKASPPQYSTLWTGLADTLLSEFSDLHRVSKKRPTL